MLTEEEAKKKWCPESRAAPILMPDVTISCITNRDVSLAVDPGLQYPATQNCIASECMAWRWKTAPSTDSAWPDSVPPTGYCGKAGAP